MAKDALALMCDALQTLGDRFAVYAFSGHGRAQVEFRVVKGFDDAVSTHTAGALSALRPHGATRSGAAIRHASALLARQPQRHKVLIVVSDGYPEDIDYGPEPRELRYAIAFETVQVSDVESPVPYDDGSMGPAPPIRTLACTELFEVGTEHGRVRVRVVFNGFDCTIRIRRR